MRTPHLERARGWRPGGRAAPAVQYCVADVLHSRGQRLTNRVRSRLRHVAHSFFRSQLVIDVVRDCGLHWCRHPDQAWGVGRRGRNCLERCGSIVCRKVRTLSALVVHLPLDVAALLVGRDPPDGRVRVEIPGRGAGEPINRRSIRGNGGDSSVLGQRAELRGGEEQIAVGLRGLGWQRARGH